MSDSDEFSVSAGSVGGERQPIRRSVPINIRTSALGWKQTLQKSRDPRISLRHV